MLGLWSNLLNTAGQGLELRPHDYDLVVPMAVHRHPLSVFSEAREQPKATPRKLHLDPPVKMGRVRRLQALFRVAGLACST